MGIPTFAVTGTAGAITGTTLDISITIQAGTANRVLLVQAWGHDGNDINVSSVQFDPGGSFETNLTFIQQAKNNYTGTKHIITELWSTDLDDIAGLTNGAYTVRITFDSTTDVMMGWAAQIDDCDGTDHTGTNTTTTGSGASQTITIASTIADNVLVVLGTGMKLLYTYSPGSGDTEEVDFQFNGAGSRDGTNAAMSEGAASSGSSVTVLATASGSNDYAGVGVEIIGNSAGGGPTITPMLTMLGVGP